MARHSNGPSLLYSFRNFSGTLVNSIGFEWMLVGMAVICFCYAPLLLFLKAPPTREEKKVGIDNGGMVSDGLPATDVVHFPQETFDTKL